MGKLFKYEMKITRRFMVILLAMICIASIVLLMSSKNLISDYDANWNMNGIVVTFMMMILFGAGVTFFVYISSLLRKDLYTDRGYLTFSLPVNGWEILGSKLLSAVVWTIIIAIVYNIVMVISSSIIFGSDFTESLMAMIRELSSRPEFFLELLKFLLVAATTGIIIYELIFLSLIIGKTTVAKYRLPGLWFIIFIILQFIYQRLVALLTPFTFSDIIANTTGYNYNPVSQYLIAIIIINIVIGTIIFLASGFLLEKKVEI